MKTKRDRNIRLRPSFTPLEGRILLDGNPSGIWIGQDGHDSVGPSSTLGGDGVQDIHIALANLPADETIAWADVSGLGGGDWVYQGGFGPWAADIERIPGSTTADLYIDPSQVETGRGFQISLRYGDATSTAFWINGGAADPNLRMPQSQAQLTWLGQDGHDLVGPSTSVGPDQIQDVHLAIANLSAGIPITAITVSASSGAAWAYGQNPAGASNAEMIFNATDPTKADVFLQPTTDLFGQTLTARIYYNNGKTDAATLTAGHDDPTLAQASNAPAAPSFIAAPSATWVGQDGQNLVGPGAARITLTGLPASHAVVGAIVSGGGRTVYVYKDASNPSIYVDPAANPLVFQSTGSGGGDLSFPPDRDEAGSTLSIRLIFDDGTSAITQVVAGTTDVGLRAPMPSATSVVAHPGDDLNALANQYGTVHLSAGVYNLSQPLTLLNPVSILADPGATIMFTQSPNSAPWTAAIKIRAGHVTLDGFAVRFAGPVTWSGSVNYGGAVIGTTDNLDTGPSGFVDGIALTHLDLQSPPVPAGLTNVEAPDLIRLTSGLNGTVANNTLNGGTTEFIGGPWTIVNNHYVGTVANSFTWDAFAGHSTHDVTISGNTAQPQDGSGKTWRFLVLTNSGANDVVSNNVVTAIGPRDTDTIDANAAELILTESYGLHFEGTPTSISANGLIVQIPTPQGGAASTGDEIAILSGPDAGQYRRIAQAIDAQTYLLDSPLPQGSYAISIATGFVGETFKGNTIDMRGSSGAGGLVLVGNHFGTTVEDNTFLGGGQGFKITAAPSETPVQWGWSHAPFLGATIADNTVVDSLQGGTLSVEHSSAIKSNQGRVYFSGSFTDNTVKWTSAFLAAHPNVSLGGITIGDPGSIDPGELAITATGNVGISPSGVNPSFNVVAGTINGVAITNQSTPLPSPGPAAPSLSLVVDSGSSATDGITNDGRLAFQPVADASGYEYRLAGSTTYLPVPSISGFLPDGLSQGVNTVFVRAFNASGNRGPDGSITFTLDRVSPLGDPPTLITTNVLGTITTGSPSFSVLGGSDETIQLLRNGVQVASRVGPGTLVEPTTLANGIYAYSVHRVDPAGNASDSEPVVVSVAVVVPPSNPPATSPTPPVTISPPSISPVTPPETTPLYIPAGTWLGQDGQDLVGKSSSSGPDGIQDVDIALTGLLAGHAISFIDIEGLGGGQWQFGGSGNAWSAALARDTATTTGHVFFQPGGAETGRPFSITIRYDDGEQVNFWIQGGAFNPPSITTTTATLPTAIATTTPIVTPPPTSTTTPTPSVPLTKAQQRAAKVAAQLAQAKAARLARAAKIAAAAQAAKTARALKIAQATHGAKKTPAVKIATASAIVVGHSWKRAAKPR